MTPEKILFVGIAIVIMTVLYLRTWHNIREIHRIRIERMEARHQREHKELQKRIEEYRIQARVSPDALRGYTEQ
jgi:hypothetical protein